MFKELQKFAKENPVFIKTEGNNTYIYSYDGNTIAYYIDNNIKSDEGIEIASISKFNNIEDARKSKTITDESPFCFDFDNESEKFSLSSNKFINLVSDFSNFYDPKDFRVEMTGVHIKNGSIFASDGYIMRLKRTKSFPDVVNMIVDFNPIVNTLNANNNKKIKPTGKSLFGSNIVSNDLLDLSVVNKDGIDALKLTSNGLSYIIISIGNSNLNFSFIKESKPTMKIKMHRESLINKIKELMDIPSEDSDAIKECIRFNLKDKLELSNYIYHKDGEHVIKMPYICSENKTNFVLNGARLIRLLKVIDDSEIELQYDANGNISRITSQSTTDLLVIAQTTYK